MATSSLAFEPAPLRLAVVSAKFPYGTNEAYLGSDVEAIAALGGDLRLWPSSPDMRSAKRSTPARLDALPLFGRSTLALAAREVARDPRLALRVLRGLVSDPSRLKVKLKNLAVAPKAFALAQLAREHGIQHIHAYWLSTPATIAYVISQLTGIPWSATAHRWDIYEGNMTAAKLASARFVRTISARGHADLARQAPAFAERIATVHLGVSIPAHLAAVPMPPAGSLRLLCAANLVEVKGHRYALEAIARARAMGIEASLVVAGDGPLRIELQRAARRLNISDVVTFRGHVAHEQLLGELAAGRYDAALLASIEQPGGLMEGVPVALMEAMALGIPCIGTTSGSIPELVTNECGVLVPHSNGAAIAQAIADLAASPRRRRALGAAARERVTHLFERETCSRELVRLIERGATWDSDGRRV